MGPLVVAGAAHGGARTRARGDPPARSRPRIAAAGADRHARRPLSERAARRQDAVRSPARADRGGRRLRRPRTARPAQGDRQRPAPGPRHRRPAVRGPRGLLLARRLDRVPGTPGRRRPDRSDHQRRLHRVLADRRRARRAAQAQRPEAARDRRGAGGGPGVRRHRDRARARRAPPGVHRPRQAARRRRSPRHHHRRQPRRRPAVAEGPAGDRPRDQAARSVAPDLHPRPQLRAPRRPRRTRPRLRRREPLRHRPHAVRPRPRRQVPPAVELGPGVRRPVLHGRRAQGSVHRQPLPGVRRDPVGDARQPQSRSGRRRGGPVHRPAARRRGRRLQPQRDHVAAAERVRHAGQRTTVARNR